MRSASARLLACRIEVFIAVVARDASVPPRQARASEAAKSRHCCATSWRVGFSCVLAAPRVSGWAVSTPERGVYEPADDDAAHAAQEGQPNRDIVLVARCDELAEQSDAGGNGSPGVNWTQWIVALLVAAVLVVAASTITGRNASKNPLKR